MRRRGDEEGPLESLRGTVERVTFRNDETLWSVVRVRPGEGAGRDRVLSTRLSGDGLVTAVGTLPVLEPGGELDMQGRWVVDPRFGEQFHIESAVPVTPATVEGMERYLGSGLVQGVGKEYARRLVRRFGTDTLDVIENEPEKLRLVEGIGPKRAKRIVDAWQAQKGVRDVMLFLHSHGVTPAYAVRIWKRYGRDAVATVKRNPYVLAHDVHGIGFLMADRIAETLGIRRDSPDRLRAAVVYVLGEAAGEGHCYLPRGTLLERCAALVECDPGPIEAVLPGLASEEHVAIVPRGRDATPEDAVYPRRLEQAEAGCARLLGALLEAGAGALPVDTGRAIAWAEKRMGISFADMQAEAIARALEKSVCVITGGPGTGKTTIVRALTSIVARKNGKVLLAAPTGRAAKRLAEATRREAKTVHRLLAWSPRDGRFQHDEDHPLDCDLLVVDETSMVDVPLMHALLSAVPPGGRLVLVGDADQLPSVGPGNVLADVLASGRVPRVRLDEIFRQAGGSLIVRNAHRMNRGLMPVTEPSAADLHDFFMVERAEPEDAVTAVVDLVTERIPRKWKMDPLRDVQVLVPMHRGVTGAQNLNRVLAERLNPGALPVEGARGGHRVGDKVMQIRNNYDLEVFNGDIGRVVGSDAEERLLHVEFDGRRVSYDFGETDEIVPAWAVSIHKSQGSEFPAVVVLVTTSHWIMLQRNLVYTAVTRGKRLVVVVGTKKALAMAVKNDRIRDRWTGLAGRLRGEWPGRSERP